MTKNKTSAYMMLPVAALLACGATAQAATHKTHSAAKMDDGSAPCVNGPGWLCLLMLGTDGVKITAGARTADQQRHPAP